MEHEICFNVIPLSLKGCSVPMGLSEMSDSKLSLVVFEGGDLASLLNPQTNTRQDGKDCAGKCCFFFFIFKNSSLKYSRKLLLRRN